MVFWGGFILILVLGALWAGLSKDPRGPGFDDAEFVGLPGVEVSL